MRFGVSVGYSGPQIESRVELAKLADELGFHSLWTAEAYGSDAITPLAWAGAHTKQIKLATGIMQMQARTPTMAAMTAATLDALSGGRVICGIGVSGPQVIEGWHGVEYGKPLGRTREYVEILRKVWRREAPLEHSGEHYTIPVEGGTGLGKPLKSILHPRSDIPIYIAALGPKNIALSAEIADGFMPAFFNPYHNHVFSKPMDEGFAKRDASLSSEFDVVAPCAVIITDDIQAGLDQVKPQLGLYIGGMGSRDRNYYNDLACRYGFEADAKKIQDLFLEGKKLEAIMAVPNELADQVSLIGPVERIRDRLDAWRESCAKTLLVSARAVFSAGGDGDESDALRALAELGS